MRRTAILMMALTVLFLGHSEAQAQTYGGTPVVGGTTATPAPGETVGVSGSGCPADAAVGFQLDGAATGATTAGSDGSFAGQVVIPADTTAGGHAIQALCGSQVLGLDINVNPSAGAPLPRTGTDTTIPLTSLALALVGLGGLLVVVTRRGRSFRRVA